MGKINNIKLSEEQLHIKKELHSFAADFNQNSWLSKLKKSFLQFLGRFSGQNVPKNYKGIYLHGGVGAGKTMLMYDFYNQITIPKKIIHFQKFMQQIHAKMHTYRNNHDNRVALKKISREIAKEARILCIDEFEINDISDAMIIKSLFNILNRDGVFIFITTNVAPKDLYKDGIQRSSFLPFIKKIENNYWIYSVKSDIDYRIEKISEKNERVLYPYSASNAARFKNIKQELCSSEEIQPFELTHQGREIYFNEAHKNILFTNFEELFERNLGYNDYVLLAERFKVIMVDNIRVIKDDENNIITRFINFIDNAYFNNVILFIYAELDIKDLYKGNAKKKEFKRTISRIKEL